METEKSEKVVNTFYCEKCHYKCSRKYDFNKHKLTRKHLIETKGDVFLSEKSEKVVNKNLTCENCNKSYVSRNGIWLHKKKCFVKTTDQMLVQLVLDVVKSNSETQKQNQHLINKLYPQYNIPY